MNEWMNPFETASQTVCFDFSLWTIAIQLLRQNWQFRINFDAWREAFNDILSGKVATVSYKSAFLPEFCYCWPYGMSSSPLVVDATAVCLFETIWVRIFLKIIKKEFKIGANISVDWTLLQKMKEGRKQGLSNLNPEWQMSVCVSLREIWGSRNNNYQGRSGPNPIPEMRGAKFFFSQNRSCDFGIFRKMKETSTKSKGWKRRVLRIKRERERVIISP